MNVRATRLNPSGLTHYDHDPIAALPEYRAAVDTVRALATAIRRHDIDIPVDDFLAMLADIGAALPYADGCPQCKHRLNPPHHVDVDDQGAHCLYRCPSCDHRWRCAWDLRFAAVSFA